MSDTPAPSLPTIGSPAPAFHANSTHGEISLDTFNGKWIVLFSHPADFTPVCSTEFVAFAKRAAEFAEKNVQLLGLSIDSVYAHIAWMRNLEETQGIKVTFPVIADLDTKVAQAYGMLHPGESSTATVRAVFVIDPAHFVRALIYYPLNAGRSVDEILRIVTALQTVDATPGIACPHDWKPGDQVILPPPTTTADAAARMSEHQGDSNAKDWYFVKRDL
jgi:peroxiredoxin (alkyl hydroperoxide reductase subunit C)